ncbi:MAG: hypothetical protein IPM82_14030 [Saprospiraceae bacterium]|nr:hypothetical protein [Saprospiraceae bacterium]
MPTNGNATTNVPLRHEPLWVTKNKPAAAISMPRQNKPEVIQIVADKQPIDQGQASNFASQKQAESFVANSASSSEIAEVSDPVLPTRTISPALLEASDMQVIDFSELPPPNVSTSINNLLSTRWSYALEGAGMSTLTSPASGGC